MTSLHKSRYTLILVLLCTLSLLMPCKTQETPEMPTTSETLEMLPVPQPKPLERTYSNISTIRETMKPEDDPILNSADDLMENEKYNPEDGILFIYVWTIDSFDFLSKYHELKILSIYNCDIAGNFDLPEIATLEYLSIQGQTIESLDFLNGFPKLESLSIYECEFADGLVLPEIESLEYLFISAPNVLEMIKNNTQLAGWLHIGTDYVSYAGDGREKITPLYDLAGLEAFISLESLSVKALFYSYLA